MALEHSILDSSLATPIPLVWACHPRYHDDGKQQGRANVVARPC